MKILTEPQVNEIKGLLLEIERYVCKEQVVVYSEKILAIILQAEQVTLKLEC